jgi:hypothetical protein
VRPVDGVRSGPKGLSITLQGTDDPAEETAAINTALVQAGFKVSRIAPQASRLEDVYLAHVAAHAHGGA